MTGMIQSSWYANSVPQVKLPSDSYYHSAIENISAGMTGIDNKEKGTNVDEYAEQVVRDILARKEGMVWRGAMSGMVWMASLLPTWVMVSFSGVLVRNCGTDEI
jgi:1-acylglycerone phosphate reductase